MANDGPSRSAWSVRTVCEKSPDHENHRLHHGHLDRHFGSARSGGGDSVFLNVTGGFESAVPYVTLYGLLHQVPVVHVFERGDRLLRSPQAPVRFDHDRFAPAADAIATLYRETDMPREEFFRRSPGLPFHERAIYEPLLDDENGRVMLSAF